MAEVEKPLIHISQACRGLLELAPFPLWGWLPRLQRASPSTALDAYCYVPGSIPTRQTVAQSPTGPILPVVTEIEETRLPGVGVRHDFLTHAGRRMGLLTHLTGRRELLLYGSADPDSCAETIELHDDDVRVLSELLGADHVTERLARLREAAPGVAVEWLRVEPGSPWAGRPAGELELAGAALVAVVRDESTRPQPPPDFTLAAGDVIVLAGAPHELQAALGSADRA